MMFQMREEDYEGLRTAQLFRLIFEFERKGVEASYHNLSQTLDDEDLAQDLLPGLILGGSASSPANQLSPEHAEREAVESLYGLRLANVMDKLAALQSEINLAQRNNETTRLSELSMLKLELTRQREELARWSSQ